MNQRSLGDKQNTNPKRKLSDDIRRKQNRNQYGGSSSVSRPSVGRSTDTSCPGETAVERDERAVGGSPTLRSSVAKEREDELFAVLERCALAGERCPTKDQLYCDHKIRSSYQPTRLAKQGRIRVEVWVHNWRVIEIMEGPNEGARTMASPTGKAPYQVVYKDFVMLKSRAHRKPSQIIADANNPTVDKPIQAEAAGDFDRIKPEFSPEPDQVDFEKALDNYEGEDR